MKRRLAIFDIDGTIFRSGLFIELFHELVVQKTFNKKVLDEVEADYKAWINRKGNYMTYGRKLVNIFNKNIIGKKEEEIKKAAKTVALEQKDKVYRFTRDLITELKKKDYYLIVISGSPKYIVSEFVKYYKFDKYFATEHEVKNGKFTGKVGGVSFDKTAAVNEIFSENHEYSFRGSYGVGDTESDIVFLEKVENPISFNPSLELAQYSKKKKWRIVVERKDVIYDLENFRLVE